LKYQKIRRPNTKIVILMEACGYDYTRRHAGHGA